MKNRVRRRARRGDMKTPMAPMIDMVFLLLVFFMTASAMSQSGTRVALELPESESSQVPQDLSDRVVVSVSADERIFWGAEELDLDALRERLAAAREESPNMKLRIRAGKTTPFGAVRRVMSAAAAEGVESYLYATLQSGEGEG